MKVSECCGAHDRSIRGDASYEDYGICPDCGDHCDWVEEEDESPAPKWCDGQMVQSMNKGEPR